MSASVFERPARFVTIATEIISAKLQLSLRSGHRAMAWYVGVGDPNCTQEE